jgi:hypothetical protein
MKLFLFKIFIYLLIILIFIKIISSYNSSKYWESRVPVIKSKINLPRNSKISLVLGSSHTFYGINSKLISKNCFNYASISQSYFEDFKILIKVNKSLNVYSVILPLSYFSNYSFLSETNSDNEFLRVYDYEKAFNVDYNKNFRFLFQKIILFFTFSNRSNKKNISKDDFDTFGNLLSKCVLKENNISDSLIAFKRHDINRNFKSHNPYLDSIINYCSIKKIELNIVIPPFSKGYRNQIIKKSPDFTDFVSDMKFNSKGKYNFIDCQNFIKENENIYFRDADHLSSCGRDLFSFYLGKKLFKNIKF